MGGLLLKRATVAASTPAEEFVGPFTSWLNVKTGYSAVGDGVTDDTTAVQNALNALDATHPVLWFPAGTYRLTATVSLTAAINISLIGADPATTTLLWDGANDDVMLSLNGVAYSRVNRLTFDGNGNTGVIGVDQDYDGSGNYFDTGNEYADDVFQDLDMGIRGGLTGYGFAETAVMRCSFYTCRYGITLNNFNALDLFVWHSRFEDCYVGVSNAENGGAAGNFNVYHSVFKRSGFADAFIQNTGSFSLRNNYSLDSARFFFAGSTQNPCTITLQGNTILDPVAGEPLPDAMRVANMGPVFLIDNEVRSLVGVTTQTVVTMGMAESQLFSIGNTYTSTGYYDGVSGRKHSISDSVVARAAITTAEPTLPGTPPNYARTIIDVASGANTAAIQSAITTAAAGTTRTVVHLPPETLNITSTLTVPASADIQILGDGHASKINWNTTGTGPMLSLASPARSVLGHFHLTGNHEANGIVVDDCDQDGARVFIDQMYFDNYTKNLVVNALDYTYVQAKCLYHTGYGAPVATEPSVEVIGGASAAAGSWLGGKTVLFSGASSDAVVLYRVTDGAHLHAKDIWYETNSFSKFLELEDNSVFSLSGFRIAVQGSPGPAILANAFTGSAALMGTAIDGDVTLQGSSSGGTMLMVGLVAATDDFYANTTSPALTALQINTLSKESPASGFGADVLSEVGSYNTTVIANALSELRSLDYEEVDAKAAGLTDLRVYRVRIGQALVGMQLN